MTNEEDGTRNGRWTSEEHGLFLKGLQLYGKDWKMISNLVKTRSLVQIRTHAQKYFMKQDKHSIKNSLPSVSKYLEILAN